MVPVWALPPVRLLHTLGKKRGIEREFAREERGNREGERGRTKKRRERGMGGMIDGREK